MPLRRIDCRLTVDFAIEIDSITEDAVHDFAAESGDPDAASDPRTWEWVGLQRRLLSGLVSRPDLLRRFVESEARSVAREETGAWVFEALGDEDETFEVLSEVVSTLDADDRAAIERSARERLLVEDTDLFWRAFRFTPTDVRLGINGDAV